MPTLHEAPTRLHEDDRITLVEGLLILRLGGVAWFLGLLAVGTLVALVPPAWLPMGWQPPMAARGAVFFGFAALGTFLALWRPAGHDPLAYALIRLRHRLTPPVAVWQSTDSFAPPPAPSPNQGARGASRTETEADLWSD